MNQIALSLEQAYLNTTGSYLGNTTGVGRLVSVLVANSITIAGIILIFLIIYAGNKIQSNWENVDAIKEGQKTITYALLGFVIVVAAYLLVRIVETSTGVSIFQ